MRRVLVFFRERLVDDADELQHPFCRLLVRKDKGGHDADVAEHVEEEHLRPRASHCSACTCTSALSAGAQVG